MQTKQTPTTAKSLLLLFLAFVGYIQATAQTAPRPFLIKKENLENARQKIKEKDPIYLQALSKLKQKADSALNRGPYSVTFKDKTPPGGTKHDYMSVGPYWWPDSTKSDGLPYIRKDGQVNPERYTIKDAAFHNSLCHDVFLLALARYYTGDAKYARHASHLLNTWFLADATRMNPHLNFGQSIPGVTNGRGIGLIDTRRVAYLIDGIQLLRGAGALSEDLYAGIRSWYGEFLDWMLDSPIGQDEARQHNNHGTYYDVQAVSIALFAGRRETARKILEEKTKERIDKQLEADGSQPHELARTLSGNYSQMNLAGFLELALLAENTDVDLWNYRSNTGKSIKNALTWMLPYAEGSTPWTYKQIKPINWSSYLTTAAVAAPKYPDIDFETLWKKHSRPANMELLLTHSLF